MSKFNIGDLVLVKEHPIAYNTEWDGPFVGVISSDVIDNPGFFPVHKVSFAGKEIRVVVFDMEPFEISPKQNWILRHQGDDMDNIASVYSVEDDSVCLGSDKKYYELSLEEFKKGIQEDFDTVGYFWRYLPPVQIVKGKSYSWIGSGVDDYFTVNNLFDGLVYYKYGDPLHILYGKVFTGRVEEIQNEVFEVEPPVRGEKTLSEDSVRRALIEGHLGLNSLSADKVIEFALKIEG